MSKYKIIIILSCILIVIAFVSGKFFANEILSNKTMKSVLTKLNNLNNKNIQVVNNDNSNIDFKTSTNMDKQQNSIENTNSDNNDNSNSSNTVNNSNNNELIVSEKMVTQNGEVIIPTKVVYKGDDYNPQNIKDMQLPAGYEFGRLNVYNNGNMVETGGTQTTNLQNFNMQLPTINNLTPGNLVIEYIVQKISNTSTNNIKIINYTNSQMINSNDVIVENTTGKPISNNELVSVIKNWILVQQYNYRGFADCNGTMWSKPWLDNISDSELVNYFVQANGNAALSENITAQELGKTATAILAYAQEHPNPFSQEQAKEYITQMLKESYPNQVISKIVFHGSETKGGDYYVYTKQYGDKQPFWYVESWIGYATGI